jgi:nucleotide-binding universal stress UspA family protein
MPGLDLRLRLSLKHILVPTDFSDCAAKAMPYAVALARKYGSKIFVAHVVRPEPHPLMTMGSIPQEMDVAFVQGEEHVAEFLRSHPYLDVPCEVLLEKGDLRLTFDHIIRDHEIDLTVLATHGRHGARKLLMGSVAEEVFRSAECPVLTLGPGLVQDVGPDQELRTILFATDFCPGSLSALPHVLALAEENGAHIIFLHVVPEPGMAAAATETCFTRGADDERLKLALRKLIPVDERYALDHSEFLVACGMPAEIVLGIAEERKVDLIVMGVRRTAPLIASTRFPWATAHKVVSQAPCPVLTVRG